MSDLNDSTKNWYNTVQGKYRTLLQKLRRDIKVSGRPARVCFLVNENSKWSTQSVYNAFANDPCFFPYIIVIPRMKEDFEMEKYDENYFFFKDQGMTVYKGYDESNKSYLDLKTFAPDIIFMQQPLGAPYRNVISTGEYLFPESFSDFALFCYVSYSFGIVGEGYYNNESIKHFNHSIWKYFCESEHHRNILQQHSFLDNNNAIVSGYPKMDTYFQQPTSSVERIWKISKANNPDIRRIIWAPHWSIGKDASSFATFDSYCFFFLELAKNNPQIDWILKPHPKLRSYCSHIKLMPEEKLNQYFNEWDNLPNGKVYDQGSYFDIFKSSHAMITDSGSFRVEYLPTGNPLLFLKNPHGVEWLDSFGESISNLMYQAHNEQDIANFIINIVFKKVDPMKEARLQAIKDFNILPEKSAGETIKEHLKSEIFSV